MTTIHNYLAVHGRMWGDDDDHIRLYEQMTVDEATNQFIADVRAERKVPQEAVDAGEEWADVYVFTVMASTAPIVIQE